MAQMPEAAADRRRRKVLYVTVGLDIGGTERQLRALALRLDRARFEPLVCCLGQGGPIAADLRRAGIHVETIGFRKLEDGTFVARVRYAADALARMNRFVTFVRAQRAEVVQTFLLWPCIFGVIAAWVARVPLVLSSRRSLNHVRQPAWGLTLLQRLANAVTHVIVANSEAVKRDVIEREHPQRSTAVVVIRNGIDVSSLAVVEPMARATLGLTEGAPVIGVVANLLRYKGHDSFLDAWRHVVKVHPSATALLVGDGPLRSALEARVREQSIPSIRFLGARSDVARLLATVDIVAHPSLEEGSANAVLEAMAAAKPVVATDVGGNAEAIVDGETGILVPPGDPRALADALLWLIDHHDTARTFGSAGRQRVTSLYGLESMVAAYEKLYTTTTS